MKKIMILMAGAVFSAGSVLAVGVNATGMATIDSNGNTELMEGIDSLMEEVKLGCICTMEYNPICAQQDEDLVTFGNQCEMDCANKNGGDAKFLYQGRCKEKKENMPGMCNCNPDIKNISCVDTGRGELITSKSDCDWKCTSTYGPRKVLYKGECNKAEKPFEKIPRIDQIPVPEDLNPTNLEVPFDDEDGWVKVDEYFSFNVRTKEWKDDQGICHTCTPENGFTENGSIVIDGKTIAGAIYGNGKNKIDTEIDSEGDTFVVLGNGIRVRANNDGEKEDRNLSLEFEGQNIEIDDDLKLEIKNETIVLEGKTVSVSVEDAKSKAKKAASADDILDFKFDGDDDSVNYVITTQKQTKFLGLFDFSMKSEVKVNVETGAVVEVDEPWYSFLLF